VLKDILFALFYSNLHIAISQHPICPHQTLENFCAVTSAELEENTGVQSHVGVHTYLLTYCRYACTYTHKHGDAHGGGIFNTWYENLLAQTGDTLTVKET